MGRALRARDAAGYAAAVHAPTCWLCGASTQPAAELAPLPFTACRACGFVFRADLGRQELRGVYEQGRYERMGGERYAAELEARRRDARVRLRWLAPHARGGTLLDVGAATGAFVAEALAAGFAAWGIEPTPAFARQAQTLTGVYVREGTLEDAALEDAALDVVTMWHVLEHVPDPLVQLERLRGALRPGGVLALEVPNYGSQVARRQRAAWPSLEPEVHVNQFAPATLRAALERTGFTLVELGTVPITPYLPPAARFAPRHLAARAKAALWLRTVRTRHPSGHELLRAIARRPPR
jgi:2-polyprenyl-3-methyl-5-hydroxy-6-metoxy-1,4-benzoquinol methylase